MLFVVIVTISGHLYCNCTIYTTTDNKIDSVSLFLEHLAHSGYFENRIPLKLGGVYSLINYIAMYDGTL